MRRRSLSGISALAGLCSLQQIYREYAATRMRKLVGMTSASEVTRLSPPEAKIDS